jgi:hypothetical protein
MGDYTDTGDRHEQIHRQQGDLMSILSFFQNNEGKLKDGSSD